MADSLDSPAGLPGDPSGDGYAAASGGGVSSPAPTTLSDGDIAAIAAAVITALQTAGGLVSALLIDGHLALDVSSTGESDEYGNLLSGVGETGSVDIVVRDNQGRIPLDGWTAVGTMTRYGDDAVISSAVACTIPYGPGGVVRYPRQTADTAAHGRYLLRIVLTGPGGQVRPVGPITHIVS